MTNQPSPSKWTIAAALASIYFIWGSTYIGIRIAIETLPPFLMAGGRFVIAGGLLYAWTRSKGVPRPQRIHWRSAAIVGGLMLLGGNGGVTWAEQHVPSSFAALMIGAVPLWIVLLDWLVFGGLRPDRRMALGLITGLMGVGLLVGPASIAGGDEAVEPIGALALVGAAIAWATGSLYSRRATLPERPLMATGIEMLAGGAIMLAVGTASGEWSDVALDAVSLRSAVAFVYLSIIGSLVAFTAYIWLLRNTAPARAASYAYVNPVVAVFLGWLLADEAISPRMIVAAAVIIGSVVMITSYRPRRLPAPSAPASGPLSVDQTAPEGAAGK